jgi:succinate dehydrogenase / fumarate reductase iron-sulfur subunit
MSAPAAAGRTARVRVRRQKIGADAHFDDFEVPVGPTSTVLDALVAIRRDQDPSLTLRHSCFHASCGTCAMRINEREGLACVTKIGDATEVTVEPIANMPVVSDLVVEMAPLYEGLAPFERPLVRSSEAEPELLPDGIDGYTRYEDCIECGICVSACPIAGSDPRYLGPAALASAWRVIEEPRGADTRRVLRIVNDAHGSWRCHVAFECTEACPSSVDPAGSIMRLRRAGTGAWIRRIFGGTGD